MSKKPINVEVRSRNNEHPERMIRRFIKKCKKEKIIEQLRDRRYYKKPSDVRRHKKQAAIRRMRRDVEKQKRLQAKRERNS